MQERGFCYLVLVHKNDRGLLAQRLGQFPTLENLWRVIHKSNFQWNVRDEILLEKQGQRIHLSIRPLNSTFGLRDGKTTFDHLIEKYERCNVLGAELEGGEMNESLSNIKKIVEKKEELTFSCKLIIMLNLIIIHLVFNLTCFSYNFYDFTFEGKTDSTYINDENKHEFNTHYSDSQYSVEDAESLLEALFRVSNTSRYLMAEKCYKEVSHPPLMHVGHIFGMKKSCRLPTVTSVSQLIMLYKEALKFENDKFRLQSFYISIVGKVCFIVCTKTEHFIADLDSLKLFKGYAFKSC